MVVGKYKYALNFETPEAMAEYIQNPDNAVELVDACFVDPLGTWHHCTFASSAVQLDDLVDGLPFDGSSIRLFCAINESDMVMVPAPESCWLDPFCSRKTVHCTCTVHEPTVKIGFSRCPRATVMRCVDYVKSQGHCDMICMGPEAEFFLFDDVKFEVSPNRMGFSVDGNEGPWNGSADGANGLGNLAHRVPTKQWYFPLPPVDSMAEIRDDMLCTMAHVGMPAEKHHHEVATCQMELGYTCQPILECADNLLAYKYIVKNVAKKHGKTATFMPKPIYGDNGTGMHVHQSLWKDGKPLFFDENGKYVMLSSMAMQYIAGLLKHAPAVLAFSNPTVNSYKRLVPGFEAPVNLVYSKGNRSAAIRIPMYKPTNPKQKRIEFRCPDPACCPHLAFSAMVMAGIDGIEKKMEAAAPCDKDIYDLTDVEKQEINLASTPATLGDALDALEADHEFLLKGGVFTKDFIKAYIAWKRNECLSVESLIHPKEYELYYAC